MLNETIWKAWMVILVILVLGAFFITSLQILNERIIRWLERKGWIEKDPVKSALKQLRIVSIFYTIAIVGLLLVRLPAFTNIISPQEIQSAEKANELQEDLHKMKEVIYWGFIIITCWFWAGYNVLKELIGRMAKESDQEAAGTPSNLRMQRRPRSGF